MASAYKLDLDPRYGYVIKQEETGILFRLGYKGEPWGTQNPLKALRVLHAVNMPTDDVYTALRLKLEDFIYHLTIYHRDVEAIEDGDNINDVRTLVALFYETVSDMASIYSSLIAFASKHETRGQ